VTPLWPASPAASDQHARTRRLHYCPNYDSFVPFRHETCMLCPNTEQSGRDKYVIHRLLDRRRDLADALHGGLQLD
jgi:hypothetical protein